MFFSQPQSFCSFFKCTIEQPKFKSTKSQSTSPQPKLKKSLSRKKKQFAKGRETSQKKTKNQSSDSKETDQKNKEFRQVKNNRDQVLEMYYICPQKNRVIQKKNNEAIYRPAQLYNPYYTSTQKRDQHQITAKRTNFFYYRSDISMTGSQTGVNTTIKTSMENVQQNFKILSYQHSQPILKTKISNTKIKQSNETLGRAVQNLVNKDKQISLSNEISKLNSETHKKQTAQIQILPNISKATQDQHNGNCLQPPKRRKNSESWQFFSNTSSSNAISLNNGSSIFLRQKTVQSVVDENSILQQESFVERIHSPAEGHILSLFQL